MVVWGRLQPTGESWESAFATAGSEIQGETMLRCLAVALMAATLSACAPHTVKNYQGDMRPRTEVAVLMHYPETGLKIFDIDGKSVQGRFTTWDPDAWREVELLPGDHTVSGGLYLANRYAIYYKTLSFSAGKRYKLAYETVNDEKAHIYLVEEP